MVTFAVVEFEDSVKLDERVVVFVASVVAKLEVSEAAVELNADDVEVEEGTIVVESLEDDGEVVVVGVSTTIDEVADGVVETDCFAEGLTS